MSSDMLPTCPNCDNQLTRLSATTYGCRWCDRKMTMREGRLVDEGPWPWLGDSKEASARIVVGVILMAGILAAGLFIIWALAWLR